MSKTRGPKNSTPPPRAARSLAVVGAGMAGIACARTLAQAGHRVALFEQAEGVGGRMGSRPSPFGSFDTGAQYFTVRDARFALALERTAAGLSRPWSANAVRVLDAHGHVAAAALPAREAHWVGVPAMDALLRHWAQPLQATGTVHLQAHVAAIEPDALAPGRWQLRTEGPQAERHVHAGFDAVLLAAPPATARALLKPLAAAQAWSSGLGQVEIAPCWTLTLAFPQAVQPGLTTLGPQWNAARSTHHRIAWLARESSKPKRSPVERWTVQASAEWSQEHLGDGAERVQAKLMKAFAEVTGIRAEPAEAAVHLWREAKTQRPLGRSHLWNAKAGLGVAGDWCLGHRVEDAFVSGLELALAAA